MHCPYVNVEVDSCPNCGCNGCCFFPYSNPNGITYPIQFNYECPDCHGKFVQPAYKYIIINTENSSTGYYAYVCPFCGKEMKGL
jgi:hypothetical protein